MHRTIAWASSAQTASFTEIDPSLSISGLKYLALDQMCSYLCTNPCVCLNREIGCFCSGQIKLNVHL